MNIRNEIYFIPLTNHKNFIIFIIMLRLNQKKKKVTPEYIFIFSKLMMLFWYKDIRKTVLLLYPQTIRNQEQHLQQMIGKAAPKAACVGWSIGKDYFLGPICLCSIIIWLAIFFNESFHALVLQTSKAMEQSCGLKNKCHIISS